VDAPGLKSPRLRIGLTGGIGSGKSTVAHLLAAHGATVIDTDSIARELTLRGGAAIPLVEARFGVEFIDSGGALDRARMRELVFANPGAKRRLEAILHPLIGEETERQAGTALGAALVFDVPLLVESALWRDKVDRVLVIDCREETQKSRVVSRSGWTIDAVAAVIAQQAKRAQRRAAADAVIFNDGISVEQLSIEVDRVWTHWLPTVP
jgi:dephospho-CoA kinase